MVISNKQNNNKNHAFYLNYSRAIINKIIEKNQLMVEEKIR